MNRFNRAALVLVAALLLVVPIVLFAAHIGIAAARGVLGTISGIWPFVATGEAATLTTGGRVLLGSIGGLVSFAGIALALAEVRTAAEPPAPPVLIKDEPGAETIVSADAVRAIATAVSAEAGARGPVVRLWPDHRGYDLEISVTAKHGADLRELTSGVREALAQEFDRQEVPVRRLDVIVYEVV